VTVSVDAKRSVWLQQAPFSLSGPAPCDSTAAWWVPVAYLSSEAPSQTKWAELNACQSMRPLLSPLPKGGWVKVNARQYGHYRVNYAPELWGALAVAAAKRDDNGFPVMKGVDLAGLLEDSYALAEVGVGDLSPFLKMLKSLPGRPVTDFDPWAAALPYIYAIEKRVPCKEAWRAYVRSALIQPFMANATVMPTVPMATPPDGTRGASVPVTFSFTEDAIASSETTEKNDIPIGLRLVRPELLKAAGFFGDTILIGEATTLLGAAGQTTSPAIDPDLRAAVYQTASRASADPSTTFNQLKEIYVSSKAADERDRALRALGYSPIAIPEALEFAIGPNVRAQDVRTLVVTASLCGGGDSRNTSRSAWEWFKSNWDRLHAKLGGDGEASRRMGQILEGVASGLIERDAIPIARSSWPFRSEYSGQVLASKSKISRRFFIQLV